MLKHKSYKLIENPLGFSIEGGSDRVKVNISLKDAHWLLEDELGMHQATFGFFEITKLARAAAEYSLEYYVNDVGGFDESRMEKPRVAFILSKFLSKLFSNQLKRLKSKIDPVILDVHRAIFTSTMGCGRIAKDMKFYTTASTHLLCDISNYRAAAIAARYLGEGMALEFFSVDDTDLDLLDVEKNYYDYFYSITREYPVPPEKFMREYWRKQYTFVPYEFRNQFPLWRCVSLLEDWKLLYSPDRTSYTALNRTLMNLPAISPRLVLRLRESYLPRPFFNRIELMFYLGSVPQRRNSGIHFFQSTEAEIRKSLKELERATNNKFSLRKVSSFDFLGKYVNDCNIVGFKGRLVSLIRRAIQWHREVALNNRGKIISHHGNQPAAVPPIPLPESNEKCDVRFLDTVEAIVAEGEKMEHCISTYIEKALAGDAYLFHIDHRPSGESASVEVDRHGKVIQSRGPRNCINSAAIQGQSLLEKWGKNIISSNPVLAYSGPHDYFLEPDHQDFDDQLPF